MACVSVAGCCRSQDQHESSEATVIPGTLLGRNRLSKFGWERAHSIVRANTDANGVLLLLADVDNTLTGDPPALELFNRFWETVHVPLGSWLCYNTARPCGPGNTESGYVELVAKKKNPLVVPDVLIAGEGTEIFWFRQPESGRFDWVPTRDTEWARRLDAIWDIGRVRAALEPHDERVWLEENRRPNCWEGIDDINCDDPFRCAIAVSKQSTADAIAAHARKALGADYVVEVVEAIWVADMYLVTALPAVAGKHNASEYVRQRLGFASASTVWAGDSDNDLPMLQTDSWGVIVGNATSDQLKNGCSVDKHFRAEASFAGGVIEGLAHFGFGN